jgi:hypothetical protein
MSYTLEWISDRSIVVVHHFGDVTVPEIQASLNEIAEQVDQSELPGLLVDVRDATHYPGEAELMLLVDRNYARPRVSKSTAFVSNEVTADAVNFVVLAGCNRGFVTRNFTDESEAIDWLSGSSEV